MPTVQGGYQVLSLTIKAHADAPDEPKNPHIYNTFNYIRSGTSSTTSSKANFLTAFKTAIMTPLTNALSGNYISDVYSIRFLTSKSDQISNFVAAEDGVQTGDSAVDFACVTFQLRTGVRSLQAARGSLHFGPIAEADTLLNAISVASLVRWNALATAMMTPIHSSDGFDYSPIVVSRNGSDLMLRGADTRPTNGESVSYNPVTQVVCNPYLGSLLRRKQKNI